MNMKNIAVVLDLSGSANDDSTMPDAGTIYTAVCVCGRNLIAPGVKVKAGKLECLICGAWSVARKVGTTK